MPARHTPLAASLATLFVSGTLAAATPVFINELHYDNAGADRAEQLELAGPAGTDLTGWRVVLYNGSASSRAPYQTRLLSGVLSDDSGSGFGFQLVPLSDTGLQNGSPDGIALVGPDGKLVQLLSYEGSFRAASGPAAGHHSVDIGVAESGATAVGRSLQLQGDGARYEDFTWAAGLAATPRQVNLGQRFVVAANTPSAPPHVRRVPIAELQGAGHRSPYVGRSVVTDGIVTAVTARDFYLQDPVGDGDPATADAIRVHTGAAPTVVAGDRVRLIGEVREFIPGGATSNNLSVTELYRPQVTRLSTGNPLPAPVLIGCAGRRPPTEVIDDDRLSRYDPDRDGIDFFESLESMRVTVSDAVAVSATNRFGETFVVADDGRDATGRNRRGGLTVQADDFNPERIQIDPDNTLTPGVTLTVNSGARLGQITGVMGYRYGNYELLPTIAPTLAADTLSREAVTLPRPGTGEVRIASYNLRNLDPNDNDGDRDVADGRFTALAEQIVHALESPAIIALQEVQDSSGSLDDGITDADLTLRMLIDAIVGAGGPRYAAIDNPPADGQDGGQPGGNIRVGYLYDPARATLVPGSVVRITDADLSDGDAFADSRKPLAAMFTVHGRTLHVVNNHFASKGGSTPLFGAVQPPVNGGEAQRIAQAEVVRKFVQALQAAEPDAQVVVLGDLNEFQFMAPITALTGDSHPILVNLTDTLAPTERYTYIYQGNAQALDHILVSRNLATHARYDVVHLNVEFVDPASDHDPVVAQLQLTAPPSR